MRPQPGGKHVAMGTHNALLGLGPRFFLEVIAVDPDGDTPARPRWFDLDEPRMKAALAEGPQLIHWVARTDDLDARGRSAFRSWARSRRWRAASARGGSRSRTTAIGRGAASFRRSSSGADARHPTDRMADTGLRLVVLAGEHPEPADGAQAASPRSAFPIR